jgi:hypothetical protein
MLNKDTKAQVRLLFLLSLKEEIITEQVHNDVEERFTACHIKITTLTKILQLWICLKIIGGS